MSVNTYRELVSIAVEKTLMDIGVEEAELVQLKLKIDYNSSFADCLEHPEYLQGILKDLYGNSYTAIIKSIEDYMSEFKTIKQLENFLYVLNK